MRHIELEVSSNRAGGGRLVMGLRRRGIEGGLNCAGCGLISALFACKRPKLGDNDRGSIFANQKTHVKKHERNEDWAHARVGKLGTIPAVTRRHSDLFSGVMQINLASLRGRLSLKNWWFLFLGDVVSTCGRHHP